MARSGITLTLEDISEFAPERADYEALLISKCHDARALVAAAAARVRGQAVGIDLFDDYFSQTADSRLMRYRTWLKQLLEICDFALCSTPTLRAVVETYRSDLPVHVVNDPAPDDDVAQLPDVLESKLARTRDGLSLRLLWFGVGDNPHFTVGLGDLAAYSVMLRRLSASGMDVELTILTNDRSLTADGLALVRQIPVRTRVEEWTQSREREFLRDAFACFLPVNGQRFSAAKSLNRAVTALSAGCQVISAGYPLYAALGNLVYRDAESFVGDLAQGTMKHSPATIEKYELKIDEIASAAREASGVARFLQQLDPAPREKSETLVLVHGQATNGAAHKAARALHGLSVGSPYCAAKLGFDIIFRAHRGRSVMLLTDGAAKRLKPGLMVRSARTAPEGRLSMLCEPDQADSEVAMDFPQYHAAPLPFQIATYGQTMARIRERLERALGPCRVFISESSPLPLGLNA